MSSWRLLPVLVLRQAGFPFEMVTEYADSRAVLDAAELTEAESIARAAAEELKRSFRAAALPDRVVVASWLGFLRPLDEVRLADLRRRLPEPVGPVLRRYQDAAVRLDHGWRSWQRCHDERLAEAATRLTTTFRTDALLRDAMLLSNDAQFPHFTAWLDAPGDPMSRRGRKMTDLLIRYLQRFGTKNETHSHFGPLTVGRAARDVSGVAWAAAKPERRTFFSHWAAERVAANLSVRPEQRDRVTVRRRPLAFLRDGAVHLYAFTSEAGLSADWHFRQVAERPLSGAERLLFELADAETTVGQLRAEFDRRGVAGFDAALESLTVEDILVARFEVPIGVPEPLAALRESITEDVEAEAALAALDEATRAMADTTPADRPAALARVKELFGTVTGEAANRGSGRHYADRSVLFEECHGAVSDFVLGREAVDFVEDELAPVYELALAGPRLRMIRETAVLTDWLTERFGPGAQVPLDEFYAAYFADRDSLSRRCDVIDAELDQLDRDLTEVLLGSPDPEAAEVAVPRERLDAFLARCPSGPPALCNPDIMLAAEDASAFARGEFLAVVGDCHATRELLTHTSFAALVRERAPEVVAEVAAAYRGLVEPDELVCDLARSHPDKTANRVPLPMPDLEIYGRSSRPRAEVITPDRLYLQLGSRIELRAEGVPGRLRLLAPPSGGPSIRLDPLAPFAFPRRLGGLGLHAGHLPHVPRIRAGRVVLQRERWHIPTQEFVGTGPGAARQRGDAAEFYAACRLRERYRLPRFVFAKVAHEPKPVFVDLDAPLLVRQLFRLARTGTGVMQLSEMLPGPRQLWLQRDGRRFTSEIRCALFTADRSGVRRTKEEVRTHG
ncbi:hypothetical protein E0H26_03605 [Micromonospora zingiberis]|uniref:Lantibiotic dehydratase N-terminal domain-containing protein n=1 Tax=Micromonospora zingiberis TaxID=2053011 RepID=A0A4V2LXA6_9ACTN|nr:lantibiotic dehydratase [Micromonospora zingiberis]TCB99655.1 hypothetical protein E0H26_03605 [Micromonospora zingiberis]